MNLSFFAYLFKSALKFIFTDKKILFIKIFGLTISLAVSLLIFSYVYFERSFDQFHENSENIYRVESNFYEGDELTAQWGTSSFGYASAMKENMPGIENFTRIGIYEQKGVVNYVNTDILFRETKITYCESSFFELFSFKLLKGNPATALSERGKVVITEEIAEKYFGKENPVGKLLKFRCPRREFECIVSGAIQNFPNNSHIKIDFLVSYLTLPKWAQETWYLHEAYSYLQLAPGTNPNDLEAAFPKMSDKYKSKKALQNKIWGIDLKPLENIHLSPQKLYEKEDKANKTSLNSLFLIGIAILLIAIINLINITTASALKRAKEVSLRKVFGGYKKHLIAQFMMETFIVNSIAILLSLLILLGTKNMFIAFFDKNIDLNLFLLPSFWLKLLFAFIIGIIISGIYPSLLLSSFNPTSALRGKLSHSKASVSIRKSLVVIQFMLTITIIIGVIGISKQIVYMTNQELGIDINSKLVIEYPGMTEDRNTKVENFSKEIKKIPGIENVTVSSSVPGVEAGYFFANRRVEDPNGTQTYEMIASDDEFISTYNIDVIAGRDYIRDSKAEAFNILVNKQGAKTFGFQTIENAVGSKILLEGQNTPYEIIGVVKNFHQQSLKKAFPPIVIFQHQQINWIPLSSISIKFGKNNISLLTNKINSIWNKHFPESTFDSFFLDEFYAKQYRPEKKFLSILICFAILSIIVALLGLWSLAIYDNSLRIKEIGVRKVNGAKTAEVLLMINKDFLKWVIISFILACPTAYLIMNRWLTNFAYRTELSWWIFAIAGLFAILIAVGTVTIQSWRAATRNPVESLRYE
ncbi:ABC transporter permease [Labilibaculum antarcticum]|uniref:ABC transporter permease n=1 Tax=Labilibaculum antarcticum TaxID=1717717 RepID=A0A1Y1CHC2_9BACT|nr:ABC transporter permease [Labilibaculum antarcticum]BAX79757.1 ABC transporter permease [Labilibaculum antarcticum]